MVHTQQPRFTQPVQQNFTATTPLYMQPGPVMSQPYSGSTVPLQH